MTRSNLNANTGTGTGGRDAAVTGTLEARLDVEKPPNIRYAYFSTPAHDEVTIVTRNAADTLVWEAGAEADFRIDNLTNAVLNGSVSSNRIILHLSAAATNGTAVTYAGHAGPAVSGWVKNSGGAGMLCFDHQPILPTAPVFPPPGGTAAAPLPANGAINVPVMTDLIWQPAVSMISQAIYFGTNSPGAFRRTTSGSLFYPGSLAPGTTYFWRVDTVTPAVVVTGQVWSFTTFAPSAHLYEWTFALGDLSPALGNGTLAFRDTTTSNLTLFGLTDGATVPHPGGQPARFMHVPQMPSKTNGYLVTFNDSGPNGGGAYINQYTIVMDVFVPSPFGWTALFNTDISNSSGNDADGYIDPN